MAGEGSRAARGRAAEDAVAAWLDARGFEVLGRNVRVGRLEVDVVCRDGDAVVVVEVRTRGEGAWQRGLDSIGARKQARVRAAGAALWRSRYAREPWAQRVRFDAASVRFEDGGAVHIEYVKAAF